MQSCSDDKVYTVKEVMDAHPDAHSILFFLPETSHIAEGDKSAKVRKLDYITFSYGYVIVKFVGEDELKLFLDEPSFGGNASMLYSSEKENNSFFVRIDNCVLVFSNFWTSSGITQTHKQFATFLDDTTLSHE